MRSKKTIQISNLGQDHAKNVGGAHAQAAGNSVGVIVQAGDGAHHFFAEFLADPGLLITADTVPTETPASLATSFFRRQKC